MIASSITYGLPVINTLIPPIYFFFQHTRTATLEITEESYLLSLRPVVKYCVLTERPNVGQQKHIVTWVWRWFNLVCASKE